MSVCNTVGLTEYSNAPQGRPFLDGRVAQQPQRLGRMGRDDDAVEGVDVVAGVADHDRRVARTGLPHDRPDRRRQQHRRERLADAIDVGPRAAHDGPPGRRPADRQHPVMVEEREQVARRVAHRECRAGRPHRSDDWRHEVGHEVRRVATGHQELAQCLVTGNRRPGRRGDGGRGDGSVEPRPASASTRVGRPCRPTARGPRTLAPRRIRGRNPHSAPRGSSRSPASATPSSSSRRTRFG